MTLEREAGPHVLACYTDYGLRGRTDSHRNINHESTPREPYEAGNEKRDRLHGKKKATPKRQKETETRQRKEKK